MAGHSLGVQEGWFCCRALPGHLSQSCKRPDYTTPSPGKKKCNSTGFSKSTEVLASNCPLVARKGQFEANKRSVFARKAQFEASAR